MFAFTVPGGSGRKACLMLSKVVLRDPERPGGGIHDRERNYVVVSRLRCRTFPQVFEYGLKRQLADFSYRTWYGSVPRSTPLTWNCTGSVSRDRMRASGPGYSTVQATGFDRPINHADSADTAPANTTYMQICHG